MAISSRKLTTYVKDVSALSDRPNADGVTSEQLKAVFMGAAKEEIKTNVNGLIDDLLSTTSGNSGADNIGSATILGVTGTTIRAQVANVKTQLDNAILGEFSPGGIGTSMIADGAVTTAKLAADFGETISELNSDISELNSLFLTSDVTLYVSTTGSDTTGDGSSGNPYATWGKALSVIPKNLNYHTVEIIVASGVYNENISINNFYNGAKDLDTSISCDIKITLLGTINIKQLYINNCRVYIYASSTCELRRISTENSGCMIAVWSSGFLYTSGNVKLNAGTSTIGTNGIIISANCFAQLGSVYVHNAIVNMTAIVCYGELVLTSTDIALTGANSVGLVSSGGIIRVNTLVTLTATTRLNKYGGGEIKTGAGVDLT